MREKRVYLKRIVLSIMMCIAVVVFLMSMKEVKATTTSPSIDTSKTGNITIHKYTKGSTSGVAGTGSSSDATTIPEGALPLENVQFTLYKVNDVSVEDYYYGLQEVSNPAITVEGLYTDSTDGEGNPIKIPDVSKLTLVVQNDSGEDIVNPGKTNNSGELLFSKLPLGIYLVVETSYPDEVTSPADPFLVSLPLTITTNENGSQWLYDVHVYPKNSTTAGVTL